MAFDEKRNCVLVGFGNIDFNPRKMVVAYINLELSARSNSSKGSSDDHIADYFLNYVAEVKALPI